MKRAEKLFRIHLVLTLGLSLLLGSGVSIVLIAVGKAWLVPVYIGAVLLLLLFFKPWDKKRFLWYLEELNPDLRERLISLYELLSRGIKHPAVNRLKEEVASLRINYRPNFRVLLLLLGVSAVFLLLSFVRLPQKPPAVFHPSSLRLLSGDTLKVSGTYRGDTLNVEFGREGGDATFVLLIEGKVKREITVRGTARISDLPPGDYTVRVKGREGKAGLRVIPRPVLYGVDGYVVPPPYTGLSRRPLQRENVAYENSTFDSLRIRHSGDSARFVNLPDTLKEDVEVLVDVFRMGKRFRYPAFRVRVIRDNPPGITLHPTGIIRTEEDVGGVVAAYDDIALKDVGLYVYRGGKWERSRLGPDGRVPNVSYEITFNAGDTLKAVAYAVDVAGQVSVSDTLILLPRTPEEVLKEKLLTEKGDEVRELEKRLKELQEELEVSRTLSQETRSELARAMRETEETYREIREALERISSRIKDPELARLVMEVRRLFRENMDRELAKALKKLEEAMRKMDPEAVARALKNLRLTQRELREELERFKKLLERYAQEKRLREMAEKLQEMATKQMEIEGKREVYEQGKLRSDLEELQKKLDSLKKIPDVDKERIAEMENLLKKAGSHMDRAIQKMRSGGNFRKDQAEARKSLEKAARMAQQTYEDLVNRRTQEVVRALNEIGDAAAFMDMRLDRDVGEKTLENAKAVALDMESKLKELSGKNVFVSPRLSKMARRIYNELEAAQQELSQGDRKGAEGHIKQAQSLLRMLSLMTSSSAQACQNAGGSTGMEAYMKQLARMAGEQKSISQQLGSGMTSEQLAEMLARQMALRKALEGMLEGMRNRGMPSDVMRQLERAIEEMKDLEREMSSPDALQKAGELKRRAQKITIRLLEARKALRRQRMEPKYEAQRPKPFKVERKYTRPVIDREKIAEIYRKYMRGERLSPEERRIYDRYIREVLE